MKIIHKKTLSIFLPVCLLLLSVNSYAGAFVHLFEWQWNDIALECENVLGPKGYSAVQVSPPQKSISGSQWWTRYQPVSYAIEGRSGSRAAFAAMVTRCKNAGVDIYVDAVINHMAAHNRVFPEVPYTPEHFNNCTAGIDYTNIWSIQNCDLVGLNDLKTNSEYVRSKLIGYLNDLTSLGVAGFRIDAAKHMPDADLANILGRLNGNPYIFQEVIADSVISAGDYAYLGDVTEFNFTNTIGHYFKGRASLRDLRNIGVWGGWLPAADAVTFVANHDNQRQNTSNIITHKDGVATNNIAHAFLLAWPYGYPKVMSSYDWANHDQGPPTQGASSCSNGWLCEHRQRSIANMVGFRNATDTAFYVSNWWDNGGNQIAFGRGARGFIAINGQSSGALQQRLNTGLPVGRYCDVFNADFSNGSCSGAVITVDASGFADFNVAAKSATAIHADAKISTVVNPVCAYPSMYLRGTFNNWGAAAMTCVNGVWTGTVSLGANARLKFDAYANWQTNWGDANQDRIAEANAADITVAAAGIYSIRFNDQNFTYSITNNAGSSSSSSSSSGTRAVTFTCVGGYTYVGQSVYVVGSNAALGNWNPATAIKLSPTGYPTWTGSIQLPANTTLQWKCLKRDELNAGAGIEWESGDNNTVNTANTNATEGAF